MSRNQTVILHVRPVASPSADGIDQLLALTVIDIVLFHDVYRALAYLGTHPEKKVLAVVLDVDLLEPSEMEFFHLVRGLSCDTLCLVHGRSDRQIAKAIAAGAHERANETSLRRLGRVVAQSPSERKSELADVERADLPIVIEDDPSRALAVAQEQVERPSFRFVAPADEEALSEADVEEEPVAPARVPWARYAPSMLRTPPPSGSPPRPQETPAKPNKETLLTPEELEALIGFDSSAGHTPNQQGGDA